MAPSPPRLPQPRQEKRRPREEKSKVQNASAEWQEAGVEETGVGGNVNPAFREARDSSEWRRLSTNQCIEKESRVFREEGGLKAKPVGPRGERRSVSPSTLLPPPPQKEKSSAGGGTGRLNSPLPACAKRLSPMPKTVVPFPPPTHLPTRPPLSHPIKLSACLPFLLFRILSLWSPRSSKTSGSSCHRPPLNA